jgi:phosphopantothenoylcysteine decarboxylase/phosphopantothenate--cysteine ligase
MDWKRNRRILLGISGGIAAYKAPDLVRGFVGLGNEVEVVLTEAAEELVSPLALSTLSYRRTWLQSDFLDREHGWKIPHISLGEWAEIVVVAPCTANMLRRAANGEAETLLGAILIATKAPILLCPAMNTNMWEHPSTLSHIEGCRRLGYHILEPDTGFLACGTEGKGRLPSNEKIMEDSWRILCPNHDLYGKKVLVTAGPTWEFMDPVRFISNPSSGKMGYAMAKTAWYRGAEVTLVSGPVPIQPPHGVEFIRVQSAEEMKDAVMDRLDNFDYIVKAAAVGDYRPKTRLEEKIKRSGRKTLEVVFEQNPDIAALVGSHKRSGQVLIGFAAESHDLEKNALAKITKKNLDFIVANQISGPSSAFGSDTNTIRIYDCNGLRRSFSGPKEGAAWAVWDFAAEKGSELAPGS